MKNIKETAAELGLWPQQIHQLMATGALVPDIHEGRLVRFDVERVRKVLAARSAERSATRGISPADQMVPTI